MTRQQHISTLLNMMQRAARQIIKNDNAGRDSNNERQQLEYLSELLIYSL